MVRMFDSVSTQSQVRPIASLSRNPVNRMSLKMFLYWSASISFRNVLTCSFVRGDISLRSIIGRFTRDAGFVRM